MRVWLLIALLFPLQGMGQIYSGSAERAEQAQDFERCRRDCERDKPGYPCWSYCGWQICEKASVETLTLSPTPGLTKGGESGTREVEAPVGVNRGVLDARQVCLGAHPACVAHCDVYTRDMRRYQERVAQQAGPVEQCDFEGIRRRYQEMQAAVAGNPASAGQVDIKGFYESHYRDVVPLERDFRAAQARLPSELTRSANALKQCKPYTIGVSDQESRVLARCNAGLLEQVGLANEAVRRQVEEWQKTRSLAVGRLESSLAALDQCRPSPIMTADITSLVMKCEPPLGRTIVQANQRIEALGRALNAAEQVLRTGQSNFADCRAIGATRDAVAALDRVPELTQHNCPILRAAGQLTQQLERVQRGFANDRRTIESLIDSAGSNFRYCEWSEFDRKLQEARRYRGHEMCWQSFPEYSPLMDRIGAAERAGRARAQAAFDLRARLGKGVGGVQPHLDGRSGPDVCAPGPQSNLAINVPVLAEAVGAVEQAGVAECMLEEMERARTMLNAARGLQAKCVGRGPVGEALTTANWNGNWVCRMGGEQFTLTIAGNQMSGYYRSAWAGKPASESYAFRSRSATDAAGTYVYTDAHPPGTWTGRWTARVAGTQVQLWRRDDATGWEGRYTCSRQ